MGTIVECVAPCLDIDSSGYDGRGWTDVVVVAVDVAANATLASSAYGGSGCLGLDGKGTDMDEEEECVRYYDGK